MATRRWYRLLALPMAAGVLLTLAGCGPDAELAGCEPTDNGAKYTISVGNDSTDKDYTVRLLVSEHKLTLDRDGENMTLSPGESKNFTVTVKKGEERYVGVLWPAPKGDDTYKYRAQLQGTCS